MKISNRAIILTSLLTFCSVVLILAGYIGFRNLALSQLANESENHLQLFVSSLRGKLEKYEFLPALLARDDYLYTALTSTDPEQLQTTNIFLQSVAVTAGASDVYLMDINGNTVAASNWNLERSFIGRNFSFRPYFHQALSGSTGRYFALGTASNQRGFYYAFPVSVDLEILGVLVVKVNVAEIEQEWSRRGFEFLVTDEDGIVFLTTRADWRYVTIKNLDSDDHERIQLSQRYPGVEIRPLELRQTRQINEVTWQINIKNESKPRISYFLMQTVEMPLAGWTVHILSNTRVILAGVIQRTVLAGLTILIAILIATLYGVNRQRQKALLFAHDRLEVRVEQRTQELQAEVEERRRAEQTLRETTNELIHAAKMAGLGQMSAGISHELNQPLTAIRSYADNARRMLERKKYESLPGNLEKITELTGNMAGIISQLRGFSHKSRGDRKTIPLRDGIEQALELFRHRIEQSAINVDINVDPGIVVKTDPLLINQVLVNLVSNAIHAIESNPVRKLLIQASEGEEFIEIRVTDSGQGIDEDVIDNIFDPFFTTKEVGLGLGLGLSISYRIMELLDGSILAGNQPQGGAWFAIRIPGEFNSAMMDNHGKDGRQRPHSTDEQTHGYGAK